MTQVLKYFSIIFSTALLIFYLDVCRATRSFNLTPTIILYTVLFVLTLISLSFIEKKSRIYTPSKGKVISFILIFCALFCMLVAAYFGLITGEGVHFVRFADLSGDPTGQHQLSPKIGCLGIMVTLFSMGAVFLNPFQGKKGLLFFGVAFCLMLLYVFLIILILNQGNYSESLG